MNKNTPDMKYHSLYGQYSGYLPKDRSAVDEWQQILKKKIVDIRKAGVIPPYSIAVEGLAHLIKTDGIVRMYVTQMLEQQPIDHKSIATIEDLLDALNQIVHTAPTYNPIPAKQNSFPMSTLFTYMMMTKAGEVVFRNTAFNKAIQQILKEWCNFLDSKESLYVLNEGKFGWLSRSAYYFNKLYEFVIPDKKAPHWGWASFNAYFHREIKATSRPLAGPDDPKVIVSANDGTVYKIARNVQASQEFWLKGQPYSLTNMLNNKYVDRFIGGSVFQSFLSGADYHRWHAPIAGTIHYTEIVNGLMFSDAESAGVDLTAGTYSQGYQSAVNTRGLVFIKSQDPLIGLVCVMPIGITEISSITITAKIGQKVKKGEEIGYFSYGGSSMCLIFEPGAVDRFTVPNRPSSTNPDDGTPIRVNAQIAIAR